jgi:hypothetical protein
MLLSCCPKKQARCYCPNCSKSSPRCCPAVLKNSQDAAVLTALKAVQDAVLTTLKVVQDAEKKPPPQRPSTKTYSHHRLPFASSTHRAKKPFDLVHLDLWTSPIVSVSGYKYYLVILDDCIHYLWTFPLKLKSDTFTILSNFFAYVSTQFGCTMKAIQCDNGREFDNSSTRTFLLTKGALLRMSCPYTSPQNDKAERIIRSVNNVICTLLFQVNLPRRYWAEGLHTATYLLNRLPNKTIQAACPHMALFGSPPSYEHLRVFGCTCYPNTSSTTPHKLSPRSTRCVLLGYSSDHKGYRCLDLATNRLIVSRHVVFDEASFPLAASPHLTDLDSFCESGSSVNPIRTPLTPGVSSLATLLIIKAIAALISLQTV